jgi:hypothetical protein
VLLLPIVLTEETSEVSQVDKGFRINCRKTPNLQINALAKYSQNTLLIFFSSNYVAVSEIQKDNIPITKKILMTKTLIPRLEGHIEAAFTYENTTYFLNNMTQMWNYDSKSRIFVGPDERQKKFGCLKNDYDITSILVFQRSKSSALMLIYHTENGTQFLTFCDLMTDKVIEKYERSFKTDATEIIWTNDNKFEGISINGFMFSYFEISAYLGNLRYVPLVKPYSDNQLLLNCPQQFCIDGKVDTILSIPSGTTYLFRGKYFWEFTTNDITKLEFIYDSAKSITDYWPNLPSNLDAAFSDSNYVYFFKNEKFWKYDIERKVTKEPLFVSLIESHFPEIPTNLDAIWFDKTDQQIYFIKGNHYFVFQINTKLVIEKGEIIPALNYENQFPNFIEINAIHEDMNENIFLFSNNYFFLANRTLLKRRKTLIASLTQEYLFSCQKSYNYSETSLYNDFGEFKQSLSRFQPINISFKPFDNYSTTTTVTTITEPIVNNSLSIKDMIKKWNDSVYDFATFKDKTPLWLMIFCAITLVSIVITSFIALFIIFRQTNQIYNL